MPEPGRRIVLFYKALVCAGGAERLLAKEYQHLSALGYDVYVITYRFSSSALFDVTIPQASLIVLGKSGMSAILGLAKAIRNLGNPPVLCSSGHVDIFLASLIGGFQYALHIHHPCFMSFNDYDKYSVLMRRYFERYARSNFGAARFIEIRDSLTLWRRFDLNVRALLSIGAKRRSLCNFVLSRFAQREKQDLYGIATEVLCGGLEEGFEALVNEQRTRRSDRTRQLDHVFTLLTIARLDINKRIDELVRAVALLVGAGHSIRMLVVGEGPEKGHLCTLVKEFGLARQIEFLGFVPDEQLAETYAESDLFVTIDWADYKITLFEALAQGLPCLVSDETECDERLIGLGYVRTVLPVAEEVALAIKAFESRPVILATECVTAILRDYTWGRYFQMLAEALAKAGMILTPREARAYQPVELAAVP